MSLAATQFRPPTKMKFERLTFVRERGELKTARVCSRFRDPIGAVECSGSNRRVPFLVVQLHPPQQVKFERQTCEH
jgi:hypothetical protein